MQWNRDQRLFKQSIQQGLLNARSLFIDSKNISASEGLRIYQESHDLRMNGFLQKDFPVLSALLASHFTLLARKYRLAYPSRFSSGNDYGRSFPEFLREQKWSGLESAAPELAHLEWSLLEILYTEESQSIGLERVPTAKETDWEQAKLSFDPSCRIINSIYPLDQIYEQEKWQPEQPTNLVLWRKKGKAFYRKLDEREERAIAALSAGLRLGEFAEREDALDPLLFADWLETGLVKGIQWE